MTAATAADDGWRLTRRGRLVFGLLIAVVLALAVSLGNGLVADAAPAAPAPRSVAVVAGDTLSAIAVRELPGVPVDVGVARLRAANGLVSTDLTAGMRLTVPVG